MAIDVAAEVAAVSRIDAIPTILDVVCQTTGMGFAAVARVTDDRWIACRVRDEIDFGLRPGGDLQVESTICNDVRDSRQMLVIDDVAQDPFYGHHPMVARYGLQSYIAVPILLQDGRCFGTLCAMDREPRTLNTPATLGMFQLFGQLIAFHLDAHHRITSTDASLADEIQDGATRERFIAVLGHDLRNPLASLEAGTRLVLKTGVDDKARGILTLMQNSIARMTGLIDDVLDFARGRLGGGLAIARTPCEITPMLEQIINELRLSQPQREIVTEFDCDGPIDCDKGRIGQLLSNLVANALTHGKATTPVEVAARKTTDAFELAVANTGASIPTAIFEDLFKPFFKASPKPHAQGLGLGLYIASEIARAHGGTLDVSSNEDETRFTFRMPL